MDPIAIEFHSEIDQIVVVFIVTLARFAEVFFFCPRRFFFASGLLPILGVKKGNFFKKPNH